MKLIGTSSDKEETKMTLFLLRQSKNPNRIASMEGIFRKDFDAVEDAVKYVARNKSCYIHRIRSSRRDKQIFWSKLSSIWREC